NIFVGSEVEFFGRMPFEVEIKSLEFVELGAVSAVISNHDSVAILPCRIEFAFKTHTNITGRYDASEIQDRLFQRTERPHTLRCLISNCRLNTKHEIVLSDCILPLQKSV